MWHGGMDVGLMFFLTLVIAGAALFALRYALSGRAGGSEGEDPETILRRRYASGELSEKEYRARLRILRE